MGLRPAMAGEGAQGPPGGLDPAQRRFQNMELPVNLNELQVGQIESAIRMITNISSILSEPYEWIQEAGTDKIRVDNVQQIRYCVQRNVWENAISLEGWIESIDPNLLTRSEEKLI